MDSRDAPADRVLRVAPEGDGPRGDEPPRDPTWDRFAVTSEESVERALERLDQGDVDCVVSEYRLADMTGVEFLRRVRREHPDVPFVLVAPVGDEGIVREALDAGAADCFPETWVGQDDLVERRIEQVVASRGARERESGDALDFPTEYELLVENVVDHAIFMLNPEGYVVTWNEGAKRLKGYGKEEILGQHFSVFYPHDAVERGLPERNLEAALEEGHATDEGWRVRKDGSQFWAHVTITALRDEEGELRGFAKITRDMTERHEKETALEREQEVTDQFRVLVESVEDYAIFRLDVNGNVVTWNEGAKRLKGYGKEEILGQHFSVFYPHDAVESGLPERNLDIATEEGRYQDEGWRVREDGTQFWAHVTITALRDEEGELRGFAKVTRDMTERRQYEQELEQQRDELAALEGTNRIIRQIDQLLVDATTREEVNDAVCTRLVGDDAYRFAWIGSHDTGSRRIVPEAWAGRGEEFLEAVDVSLDEGPPGEITARALETKTTQTVQNVRSDPGSAPWRRAALDCGFQAAVAVPLVYGESIYGVLCVYGSRPYAFDDREVEVLTELGETIGHVINALRTKKMLLAERVTELEFRIADRTTVLGAASAELDARVQVAGATPSTDDAMLYYVNVTGAAPDAVRSFAEDLSGVEGYRLIDDADGGALFELQVTDRSPVGVFTEYGGDVQTATADGGELRIVVDVPPDAEIRAVVDEVRTRFEEVTLVSQSDLDRTVESEQGLHATLEDDLTERQQTVLRSAYHAGYLRQPRESTGDELADSLGITASTFHQHFRVAERKLIEAFLDE